MRQVLRTFDSMLSEGVTNEMVKAGIDLHTHTTVRETLAGKTGISGDAQVGFGVFSVKRETRKKRATE